MVFAIPMEWFERKLVFYLLYTLFYLDRIAFHSYLPNLPIASLSILVSIWLTMCQCFLHRQDIGWSRSHVPVTWWSCEL
jgi:hypothetical protein